MRAHAATSASAAHVMEINEPELTVQTCAQPHGGEALCRDRRASAERTHYKTAVVAEGRRYLLVTDGPGRPRPWSGPRARYSKISA